MKRLCGRMPEPLMADAGVEQWISSWRAIPASPSPSRADGGGTTTSETSGQPSSASSPTFSPEPSFSKMWLDTFDMDTSMLSSQRCERLATQARRRSSALLKRWVPRIAASACSRSMSGMELDGWQTPTGGGGGSVSRGLGRKSELLLSGQAAALMEQIMGNWQTPTAKNKRGNEKKGDGALLLPGQAVALMEFLERWATPVVAVTQNRGPAGTIPGLEKQARDWMEWLANFSAQSERWATANATEAHKSGGSSVMAQKMLLGGQTALWGDLWETGLRLRETLKDGSASSPPAPTSRPRYRLSPPFVEWLMGWPDGATSVAGTESASSATA